MTAGFTWPARLQYGAGLRRSELVRLRIKDIDLERGTLTVRQGRVKGFASRDHLGDGGRAEVVCVFEGWRGKTFSR